MLNCKYCDSERKNKNSLAQHEIRCKENPERINPSDYATGNRKGCLAWNSGKTGVYKHSDESKLKMSEKMLKRPKEWFKENGKKVSETIQTKVAEGTWHTSLAKNMHYNYNGVDLHGTWELKYAQYLDKNNIKWIRCKEQFDYFYDGKNRKYTPDFYLIESDEYIEIKGFKTDKDSSKWKQFPKDKILKVLLKEDLQVLNII